VCKHYILKLYRIQKFTRFIILVPKVFQGLLRTTLNILKISTVGVSKVGYEFMHWCIFLDIYLFPIFIIENTIFQKLAWLPSSGKDIKCNLLSPLDAVKLNPWKVFKNICQFNDTTLSQNFRRKNSNDEALLKCIIPLLHILDILGSNLGL
jgi:hypothetical protein